MTDVFAFDWDGVVVDSLPIRDEGFRKAFLTYGEDIAGKAKAFHIAHRGLFRRDKLARIFKEVIGITPTGRQIAEAEKVFVANTYNQSLGAPLLPGTEVIKSLSCSKPVYVVSALPEGEVQQAVAHKGLESCFKRVLGGPEVKSAHLESILTWEQCGSKQLLFAGDAYKDYEAALKVNCQFIGIVRPGKPSPFPQAVRTAEDLGHVPELACEDSHNNPA